MTDHVILRHAKLKSFGEIGGSLDHTYRLIDTPNADSSRLFLNENDFNKKTDVLEALKNRIDQRVSKRPDNVLCVEYLVTASPTWDGWGTDKETEFFNIQKERLIKKWGAENVISTHIHRDETTPHLVVYIVPFDEEKKALNCKKWLGNRTLLQEEQTEAAEVVKHLGLSRGLKNSKAEHRTIKQHYEIVNQTKDINEFSPSIDNLPEPTLADRLNPKKYAERVIEQVLPDYKNAKIESIKALETQQEVKALREIAKKAEPYLNAVSDLPINYKKSLDQEIKVVSDRFRKEYKHQYEQELKQFNSLKNTYYEFESYVNNCIYELNNQHAELDNRLSKTQKWLKKSKKTESEYESYKSTNRLFAEDQPNFYIQQYQYEYFYKRAINDHKEKIAKKAEEKNIERVVLKLKEQSADHKLVADIKTFDDYVMPIFSEYQLEQQRLRQQKEYNDMMSERRIAQNAIREREIQAGREAYKLQKRAENRAYRANESTIKDQRDKRDNDNDFSM